jgi:TRAP-type C4-dicarboxylate transport system permease small subunit
VACLAGSEAYRMQSHVGVDFVARLLPEVPRRWVSRIAHLAVFVLMVLIFYQGITLSWMLMDQQSPALEIPMGWPYLAVPVGAVFIAIHALIFFIKEFGPQRNEA